jgi:probable HAF family extracellular repeat protein
MSADGQVLVGESGGRAFRWSAAKGMIDLGTMPAKDYFVAWGASGDGSVVVGSGDVGGNEQFTEPFLWTSNTGMKKLGFLTGDSRGEALAVSKDGQVIVGYSANNLQTRAFRRGPDGVMRALDVLGEYSPTVAHAVSSDGSVVVGETGSWGSSEAFRWSQSQGIQLLGVLEGDSSSEAAAVSGDGTLVVGYSSGRKNDKFTSRAFIWDSARGMREIQSILKSQYDLDLPGWTLDEATAISSDGTAIVGEGTNPQGKTQAWIVRITDTQPTLSVKRDGTSLKLRWRASFGKYELQSITSFVPSGVWQPVTNAPVLIEGEWVVTQFVTDAERFFRLRQQ